MPFGEGPFGEGPFDGPVLCAARATAMNAITATMGMQATGLTLDARMWRLTPEPGVTARLVQHVEATSTGAIVYSDGQLQPGGQYELRLLTPGVDTSGCDALDVVGRVLSKGAIAIDAPQSPARLAGIVDLANPQLSIDAGNLGLSTLGGMQADASGDLASDYGIHSLRKRIIRRLTTQPGSFFHLPTYGAAPKVKGLLRADDAKRLELRFRAQILQEPDVADALVRVVLSAVATNVLSVYVRATLLDGTSLDITTTTGGG